MQKKHTDANPLPPELQEALAGIDTSIDATPLEPMFEHGYQVLRATIALYQNEYRRDPIAPEEKLDEEIIELNALIQDDPDMSIEEAWKHSQASYRRLTRKN